MILISWYNLVAIIVGLLFIWYLVDVNRNIPKTGFLAGVDEFIKSLICIVIAIIFFSIWGGIFWW